MLEYPYTCFHLFLQMFEEVGDIFLSFQNRTKFGLYTLLECDEFLFGTEDKGLLPAYH